MKSKNNINIKNKKNKVLLEEIRKREEIEQEASSIIYPNDKSDDGRELNKAYCFDGDDDGCCGHNQGPYFH